IKDGIIKNIENDDDGSIIHVPFEVRRDIHECPSCRELTDSIHDYRIQKIKGPPLGEKFILFHYRKRRYVCSACGKRFYENNSFVPRYPSYVFEPGFIYVERIKKHQFQVKCC